MSKSFQQYTTSKEYTHTSDKDDLIKRGFHRASTLTAQLCPNTTTLTRVMPSNVRGKSISVSDDSVLINTVLGTISSHELGLTHMHEHIFVSSAGLSQVYPERVPKIWIEKEAIKKLKDFRAEGGNTIIDVTTHDLGRDIRLMERVSRGSGVNIIAATGCWLDVPRSFKQMDPNELANLWIREATVGIDGTEIKAGVIKLATETGETWNKGKFFTKSGELTARAAARTAKATKLPIITHTEVEEHIGLAQIAIFEEEGVDLRRVCIGHSNDSWDMNYLIAMLKKGVYVGLDRTRSDNYIRAKKKYNLHTNDSRPKLQDRINTIKKLIDAGWANKIMLSHDAMVYYGHLNDNLAKKLPQANPDVYSFILRQVIPKLMQKGVSKKTIHGILHDNPRRLFENFRR